MIPHLLGAAGFSDPRMRGVLNHPPNWEEFKSKFGKYEQNQKAPSRLPTGQELYNRAQRTKSDTAAGSDAWKPVELKALPQSAWEARATIFQLSSELARFPSSYYEVTTVALPKKDKGTQPLDHRLLAIFSSLYRIEAGAWCDHIKPWLRTILHKDVMGAIEGTEALDIA